MKCPKIENRKLVCGECFAKQICEQTNEEWLNSLNTTEKAKWLQGTSFSCNACTEIQFEWYRRHEEHCPLHCACAKENGFELWLKEEHI